MAGLLSAVPATGKAGAAPACGGTVLLKPNGTAWQCSFDDEFSATTLDTTQWTAQLTSTSGYTTGPLGERACYVNNPSTISESGGYLRLTAQAAFLPFACKTPSGSFSTQFTSGEVTTYNGFNQTYGRFEVRAKLPPTTAKGLQETMWLWPVNPTKYGAWPQSGEIDFAEFYSQYPTLDVPYVHYAYAGATTNTVTDRNVVTAYDCAIDHAAFNTYAVVWAPGTITILTNGKTCLVDNYAASNLGSPAPFDQPFFLALTQALGVGSNAFTPIATPLPATTQIDYVRAWK